MGTLLKLRNRWLTWGNLQGEVLKFFHASVVAHEFNFLWLFLLNKLSLTLFFSYQFAFGRREKKATVFCYCVLCWNPWLWWITQCWCLSFGSQLLESVSSGCACHSNKMKQTLLALATAATRLECQRLMLSLDPADAHCDHHECGTLNKQCWWRN